MIGLPGCDPTVSQGKPLLLCLNPTPSHVCSVIVLISKHHPAEIQGSINRQRSGPEYLATHKQRGVGIPKYMKICPWAHALCR